MLPFQICYDGNEYGPSKRRTILVILPVREVRGCHSDTNCGRLLQAAREP
jgi:hypothetical protein